MPQRVELRDEEIEFWIVVKLVRRQFFLTGELQSGNARDGIEEVLNRARDLKHQEALGGQRVRVAAQLQRSIGTTENCLQPLKNRTVGAPLRGAVKRPRLASAAGGRPPSRVSWLVQAEERLLRIVGHWVIPARLWRSRDSVARKVYLLTSGFRG